MLVAAQVQSREESVMHNRHEDVSDIYNIAGEIDTEVPDGVVILSMLDTHDKAESSFHMGHDTVGFNGTGGFAVWNIAQNDTYWILCQMTAEDPRPLCLSTNGRVISTAICSGVTGSWESEALQWFHYGPFQLEAGLLKVDTDGYWPHVKRLLMVPTNATRSDGAETDKPLTLLKPSHPALVERLASIPQRRIDSTEAVLVALRRPKNMSDNVCVGDNMITVEGERGYYEFEFVNEVWAEEVYLDVTYASGDSRPVILHVNGETSGEKCCREETGGYEEESLISIRCGPFPIKSEVNMIKVTTTGGFFPHISEIRVVNAITASDEVTKPLHGTWIVPPSRPIRPELPHLDFCFIENTQDPNPEFEPDPGFYNSINLDGFWILASKEVDTRILKQAAELMSRYIPVEIRRLCLQWRAPKDMPRGPFRLIILDNMTDQNAGDCPDFPDEWEGRNGTSNPGIFTSAEDFCLHPAPRQGASWGELTVHEVTHGLDMVIRQQIDPYFFQQVDDCWRHAVRRKVFQKAYAAADRHEYLAEICTLFVGTCPTNFKNGCSQCTESESGICDWKPHRKFPPGKGGVQFTKKRHLRHNDRRGYELLKSFLIEIKHPEDDSFWWEHDEY